MEAEQLGRARCVEHDAVGGLALLGRPQPAADLESIGYLPSRAAAA
jgi:hypothetical protein